MNKTIGIIGGGITGLHIAWQLKKAGAEVRIWEGEQGPGGVIQSHRKGAWLFEYGPNSLQLTDTRLTEVFNELGLQDQICFAKPSAKNRYVVKHGAPLALPSSPMEFLRTKLVSTKGKFRLLMEPFVAGASEDKEESVADFVRRRIGQEWLDYAINPFVGGIYAGNPEKLSLKFAFPLMYELEEKYGSLVKAQFKIKERYKSGTAIPRSKAAIVSFKDGLQTLAHALSAQLQGRIQFGKAITSITRDDKGAWLIHEESAVCKVDELVLTLPHYKLRQMNTPFAGYLKTAVQYPAVQIVHLGVEASALTHPLDGFGMLIPEKEGFPILGTVFSSSVFDFRAPAKHALLTTFLGGARNRDSAVYSDAELMDATLSSMKKLGLVAHDAQPIISNVVRWKHAIPQYELGYGAVLNELHAIESDFGNIHFAGNYRYGISMVDSLLSAFKLKEKVLDGSH